MSINDYDEDLYEAVRALVDDNELEENSAAYGIAMKVVHEGHNSLSERQAYIYQTQIEYLLCAMQERQKIEAVIAAWPD